MTRRQFILVHIAICALVVVHLFAIVTGIELWPFSPYPMYSELNRDRALTVMRVVGIEQTGREVSIDAAWLRKSFNMMRGDEIKTQRALDVYAQAYKLHRPPGVEPGPPFVHYLLYEQSWELRTDGSNVDKPDHSRLVAEAHP